MKNLNRIVLVSLCLVFCLAALVGCGSGELPEITKSKITQDLEIELEDESYSYDTLDNLTYEKVDVTEDDLNRLKEFFDSRVDYQKINCSFQLTSIKMDSVGYWSMIYAYVNGEWKMMFSYQNTPEDWEYVAKETASSKKILSDLKTVEFEGFEEGYVGNEKTTTLRIVDRDTKLKINKDDVYIEVTTRTDFATYLIEVELIYYFNNGEWQLSDAIVQDSKYWQLTYNSDKVPDRPDHDYILEQVTKSYNFLTYVANIDYMESYNLVETKQLAGVTTITFQYDFYTKYKRIGEIRYLIQIPYEWVDGEWAVGDMTVEVANVDVKQMLGTWTAQNGDYIEFSLCERASNSKYEAANILVGTYYKKTGEGTYSKYTIKCEVDVPLRDNSWDGEVILWEAKDMSSVEYTVDFLVLDVVDITLKSGDLVFKKTIDLVPSDSVENPTTESVIEPTESSETVSTEVPSESSEVPSETSSEESSSESEVSSEEITSEDKTAIGG